MGWHQGTRAEQRLYLVQEILIKGRPQKELCEELGVHRQSAYKWIERYKLGGMGALEDQSRRPHHQRGQLKEEVRQKLVALRVEHPTWGPKKLLQGLLNRRGQAPCCIRTLGRWLRRLELSQSRRRRLYHGVTTVPKNLTTPKAPNGVWTVDFKGQFHTQDGQRANALTVRDLYSRYGLAVDLLGTTDDQTVRPSFIKLFVRHGLPKIIRVDNGIPFAGNGPHGYSSLSLWWSRLHIQVEFTRLARPGDNGSHEQFHRVYKAEALSPAAATVPLQQQRSDEWLVQYNQQRPHEALAQRVPAELYRDSRRHYRPVADPFIYPKTYKVLKASSQGFITWKRRVRLISRVVAGLKIGLKPINPEMVHVYVDKILLGSLHLDDTAGMRAIKRAADLAP